MTKRMAERELSGSSFTPVVDTTSIEAWHASLHRQLGDCRVDVRRSKALSFAAQISACAIGGFTLVELRSEGGQIDLRRRQRSDAAVLWIPEQGAMEERLPGTGEVWQPAPGQALWIAPGTELQGITEERCAGVSIVLPAALLANLKAGGGPTTLLNPFQTQRLPTLTPLLRSAREMIAAARHQPSWLLPNAALFWGALVRHWDQIGGLLPMEPDSHQASRLSNQFLKLANETLQTSPQARFHLGSLALALNVAPRTLQGHLRRELDASPREVLECLRRGHSRPGGG